MSDTAAIQALLDTVQDIAPKLVTIPPGTYNIDGPLTINYTASTFSGGLSAYGVRFNSSITDGANLLTINVAAGCYCRGQKFMGLDLIGSKTDGHGLCVSATGDLYNFIFRDIGIESFGGDGLHATGACFEGTFENIRPRSNRGNGATLGNSATGGIMSTVAWIGGSCGQNGKYGMEFVNNAYDIKIRDTYFLLNGLAGLHCPNGCYKIEGGGFENNQQSLTATNTGPAISGQNFITIIGCTEGSEVVNGLKQQTSLLDGFYSVGEVTLIGVHTGNGIGKITGSRRCNLIGCS